MATKRVVRKTTSTATPKFKTTTSKNTKFDNALLLKNKKKLSLIIGLLVVIALIALVGYKFKSVFIAATVNGEPISRLSVITTMEQQNGKTVLNNLIVKKLILQDAKNKNITVSQAEIDAELKKIKTNIQNQGSTLEQALSTQNMTLTDLTDEIKVQLVVTKLAGNITSTEKEVDDFVTANKAQMAAGVTELQFREQAVAALKQQKLQTKIQEIIKSLQDKAKIIHFVSY